jgi:RNA polymerase sigma-70 factor (ECF subfamily)
MSAEAPHLPHHPCRKDNPHIRFEGESRMQGEVNHTRKQVGASERKRDSVESTPLDETRPRDNATESAALWLAFCTDPVKGVEVLYDRYAKLVYGLARTVLSDAHEAEDLTHEVFMSLLSRCTYDPARGTLAGYLCTVTRSRAIDRRRSRTRNLRLIDRSAALGAQEVDTPAAAEDVAMEESAQAVRNALAQLPLVQRQVLELAYFKGLTQTEIALQLDAPLGTVKSWTRRGLYSLRTSLGDWLDLNV